MEADGADLRSRLPADGRPQFDAGRVAIFVEVEGAGDYFPTYAGNLDIMTAAATKVGEEIARQCSAASRGLSSIAGDAVAVKEHGQMPYSAELDIRVTDSCMRDGSHAVAHQFTETAVRDMVRALDGARVPVLEVTHGDGLGGSSFNYGFSKVNERKLIKIAVDEANHAKIACLMLPGVGTVDDIRAVRDLGVSVVRVATHCSEADISAEHFGMARELGPGDRRLLDDGALAAARGAGQAGPDHGRRRLPVRVRGRFGRRPDHGAGQRSGRGPGQRARRRRPGRLPRPPEPVAGGGQLAAGDPGRRTADRRAAPGRSAPAPATPRPRCWRRSASGSASRPASTCSASSTPPRTSSGRSWTTSRSLTGCRS